MKAAASLGSFAATRQLLTYIMTTMPCFKLMHFSCLPPCTVRQAFHLYTLPVVMHHFLHILHMAGRTLVPFGTLLRATTSQCFCCVCWDISSCIACTNCLRSGALMAW